MAQGWQYLVVDIATSIGSEATRDWLDTVGRDGWELISVVQASMMDTSAVASLQRHGSTTGIQLYLKRPLPA